MQLGTHCAERSCRALDFLPLTCRYCERAYCRAHAAPERHRCRATTAAAVVVVDSGPDNGAETGEQGDERAPLPRPARVHPDKDARFLSLPCSARGAANASSADAKRERRARAEAVAAAAAARNPRLARMCAKARARGNPNVPDEDRVYVSVSAVDGRGAPAQHHFYASRHGSVGQFLDQVCRALGIENRNNVATSAAGRLRLERCESGAVLEMQHSMGEVVALDDRNDGGGGGGGHVHVRLVRE